MRDELPSMMLNVLWLEGFGRVTVMAAVRAEKEERRKIGKRAPAPFGVAGSPAFGYIMYISLIHGNMGFS